MISIGKLPENSVTALLLSGFVSFAGLAVVVRELVAAFHGVDLVYPLAIGGWLFFIAAGELSGKSFPSIERIGPLLILFSVALLSEIVFIRSSALLFDKAGLPSIIFPLRGTVFIFAIIPESFITGLLLSESSRHHLERGGYQESAYGLGALGGMAGCLAIGMGIRYGFSNLSLALLVVFFSAAAALLFFKKKKGLYGRVIAASLAVLAIVSLCKASRLDMKMTAWSHPGLFFCGDFPSGRLSASYNRGDVSVFENGILAFTTQDINGALFAHLAALQHPEPRRILEIGGGWGGVRELLLHKPVRVDVLLPEGDPYIRFRLPADVRKSLADPSVHLSPADPRIFLKNNGFAWDLIIIDVALPLSCRKNVYYTQDFFSRIATRLYKGGIVAIHLPPVEAIEKNEDLMIVKNIYHNLAAVFPERRILSGQTTIIAASFAPFHNFPQVFTERLHDRGIKSSLLSSAVLRKLSEMGHYPEIGDKLKATSPEGQLDIRPTCYTRAAANFIDSLLPTSILSFTPNFYAVRKSVPIVGGIGFILLFLFFAGSRLRLSWRKNILMIIGGFLGTANLSLLILCYNLNGGTLYQDIPLLLTGFMAGLSLGAPLLLDLTGRARLSEQRCLFLSATLLACFILLDAVVIVITKGDVVSLPNAIFIPTIAGFLSSGLLFCTNACKTGGFKKIRPLFTANLIGGALGALATGIVLVPVVGTSITSMALVIVEALAFLVI